MRRLKLYEMEMIEGGTISPKDCLYLGAFFTGFILSLEPELAAGTYIAATAGGCFD